MPTANLFHQPASRLREFVRRKELHWRATNSRSCKSKRKSLPTWLGNDCDLGNLMPVRDVKVEVIPIRVALPAFKVLKNRKQARFRSGVDVTGECPFLCAKFGSFQNAANAQHTDIVRLVTSFAPAWSRLLSTCIHFLKTPPLLIGSAIGKKYVSWRTYTI